MDRAEAPGFLTHARLMLANAASTFSEDWDNPAVQMSPLQVDEMRKNLTDCKRFLKEIEPFVKAFEGVSTARKTLLVAAN